MRFWFFSKRQRLKRTSIGFLRGPTLLCLRCWTRKETCSGRWPGEAFLLSREWCNTKLCSETIADKFRFNVILFVRVRWLRLTRKYLELGSEDLFLIGLCQITI